MTSEDIERRVIRTVAEQFCEPEDKITRETHIENDLHGDSLDAVELVMELEDEFDLPITDEDAEKLKTVGDAVDYLVERLN